MHQQPPLRSRGFSSAGARRLPMAWLAALWTTCALLLGIWSHDATAQAKPTLFVFLNTDMKAHALQEALSAKLPNATVTVFGRYKDFEKSATGQAPDAVVSLRAVLDGLGMKSGLQGTLSGAGDEAYALVAVGRTVTPAEAQAMTIGCVDVMGRNKMPKFVGSALGGGEPKVKLVTKTEDLLALLQFKEADAVFLPERQVKQLMGKSELDLKSSVLPSKVGLPSAALLTPAGQSVGESLKALDAASLRGMGVESWK